MLWLAQVDGRFFLALLFLVASFLFSGCSLLAEDSSPQPGDCFASPLTEARDSVAEAPLIHWHPEWGIPITACGYDDGRITNHLNLTELHGEREFTRNARLADLNGNGRHEILTRTMNENRVRALNPKTGETLWVSPDVLSASRHPQASDLAVEDVTGDGNVEVLIVSYDGHVLCINGADGSILWWRNLPFHINNPDLQASLGNITAENGLELALTVGNDFEWGPRKRRPRINFVRSPSVLVLQSNGETAWVVEDYAENNSNGHKTWAQDIDRDGFAEVFAIGERKIVAFEGNGDRRFSIPLQYAGHPDQIVFGEWATEHPGKEVIYTDGIQGIGVASSQGEILQHHEITQELQSHLQDLFFIPTNEGPRLFAQNIRDEDAKAILYDENLTPQWVSQLGYDAAMQHTKLIDWTGDGDPEIATGSISETGDRQCSVQVMKLDGTPLYWHRWVGYPLCVLTDATAGKLVLGVGWNEGSEGRYSLPSGQHMNLLILNAPPHQSSLQQRSFY